MAIVVPAAVGCHTTFSVLDIPAKSLTSSLHSGQAFDPGHCATGSSCSPSFSCLHVNFVPTDRYTESLWTYLSELHAHSIPLHTLGHRATLVRQSLPRPKRDIHLHPRLGKIPPLADAASAGEKYGSLLASSLKNLVAMVIALVPMFEAR